MHHKNCSHIEQSGAKQSIIMLHFQTIFSLTCRNQGRYRLEKPMRLDRENLNQTGRLRTVSADSLRDTSSFSRGKRERFPSCSMNWHQLQEKQSGTATIFAPHMSHLMLPSCLKWLLTHSFPSPQFSQVFFHPSCPWQNSLSNSRVWLV